ncbi:SUMF1/EgtB/PvdO family nonheme iron enzyme [bacterium]|nr:SUMF1/EgtB/PvdO family nonheme iron enzyme [bacterium]
MFKKTTLLLILAIFTSCESEFYKAGEKGESCKSDKSCNKNLYCNIETDKCEACSNEEPFLITCDKGECTVYSGDFCMGCQEIDGIRCNEDELPYHKVYTDFFKIDQYEVTVEDYQKCVEQGRCSLTNLYNDESLFCNYGKAGKEKHPMNCINWYGANEYCRWKGKRLPREAEWEKAARGNDGRNYPWKEDVFGCTYSTVDPDEELNSGNEGCEQQSTSLVDSFPESASPYGLFNTSGNVMEWVNDYYDGTYYSNYEEYENPKGPTEGRSKVLRGGGWRTYEKNVYTFRRERYVPEFGHDDYGFRCARDVNK